MTRNIIKSLCCVVILTLVNFILLVGTFFLPIDEMRENVARSSELFNFEGVYPHWDTGYKSTKLDGWTEGAVYGMAIYQEGGSPLENAILMHYIDAEGVQMPWSMTNYANHADKKYSFPVYGRYWYGSVGIIKVLLLFFDVSDIRMLNCILQMTLMLLILIKMIKTGMDDRIVPFIVAIMIIDPISMVMCLTYSSDYIPMLLAILAILYFYDYVDKLGWMVFFAVLGAVMAFFSMLSFPLIALGIPLLFKIWCDGIYGKSEKNELLDTVICSGAWGISYGIAWGMKWIIGTLFTDFDFIGNALGQADSYYGEVEVTVLERLFKNVRVIVKWPYLLMFIAAIIIIVVMSHRDKNNTTDAGCETKVRNAGRTNDVKTLLAYFIIMFLPFAMMIALGDGYANTHYWMAYKQLSITAGAGLCIISDFIVRWKIHNLNEGVKGIIPELVNK